MVPESSMWLVYLAVFIGPFVQEDAAVISAASLSVSESGHWLSIFLFILAGLITSDSWKYWLGWAAKHHKWARKYGQNERVLKMKEAILGHTVKTLIAVRFIPLARIPGYLATGFFEVPYIKYWLCIAFSALLYICMIFSGFHLLGELMGEHLKTYMPLVGLGVVLAVFGLLLVRFISARLRKGGYPH